MSIDADAFTLITKSVRAWLDDAYLPASWVPRSAIRQPRSVLNDLHHFVVDTTSTVGSVTAQRIATTRLPKTIIAYPYLLHAAIAVSVSHLIHQRGAPSEDQILVDYHWHCSLQHYQKELSQSVGPHNIDAVVSTSMLLVLSSFILQKPSIASSWLFSGNEGKSLGWLHMKLGLHVMYQSFAEHFAQCSWLPIILNDSAKTYLKSQDTTEADQIIKQLCELCEISEIDLIFVSSTPRTTSLGGNDDNPYMTIMQYLVPLLRIDVSPSTFDPIIALPGKVSPRFLRLLQLKDHRAVLILGYWLAIMCQMDLWWANDRSRVECQAICLYLRAQSHDFRVLKLLAFPESACGLKDGI